jgi:hypothetical protein
MWRVKEFFWDLLSILLTNPNCELKSDVFMNHVLFEGDWQCFLCQALEPNLNISSLDPILFQLLSI